MFGASSGGFQQTKKSGATLNQYDAIICRTFPKERFQPTQPPRVEVLLEKHSHFHTYGFISIVDKNSKLKTGVIKRNLYSAYITSCGSQSPQDNSRVEAPPLIAVSQPKGSANAYVFMVNQIHNAWIPKAPAKKRKHIDYVNEPLVLNGNTYNVTDGHVWVNITDFHQQCANQQGKGIIENNAISIMRNSFASIGQLVSDKLRMMYHRTFSVSSSDDVIISQDTQFQIKCSVNYAESMFQLCFVNISPANIQFAITNAVVKSPDVLEFVASEININDPKTLSVKGTMNCKIKYAVKGYFSLEDLPVMDVVYLTTESLHRCRIRIPIFLFRLCEDTLGSKDPAALQNELSAQWKTLPNPGNFQVPMKSTSDAEYILKRLKEFKVPLYAQFGEFYPIVAVLGGKCCIQLLQFALETVPGQQEKIPTLNIQCQHSEPNLYQVISEVVYGLASSFAGFEVSFLDAPPFAQ